MKSNIYGARPTQPMAALARTILAVAAIGCAACAVGAHQPVQAADLFNEDQPPRTGSAYDDPRYADLYGQTPRPRPRVETYRPYEGVPIPRERVYRDDEREWGPQDFTLKVVEPKAGGVV